jgi:hypothetical protein
LFPLSAFVIDNNNGIKEDTCSDIICGASADIIQNVSIVDDLSSESGNDSEWISKGNNLKQTHKY